MPDGGEGRVTGRASAAGFSVGTDGKGRGHVLSGQVQVGRGGDMRRFDAGEMFAIAPGRQPQQVVSNGAQATPDADATAEMRVADMQSGGTAGAEIGRASRGERGGRSG